MIGLLGVNVKGEISCSWPYMYFPCDYFPCIQRALFAELYIWTKQIRKVACVHKSKSSDPTKFYLYLKALTQYVSNIAAQIAHLCVVFRSNVLLHHFVWIYSEKIVNQVVQRIIYCYLAQNKFQEFFNFLFYLFYELLNKEKEYQYWVLLEKLLFKMLPFLVTV